MKHSTLALAAILALGVSATAASAAEQANANASAQAGATATTQEQGFFDKVGNFFSGEGKAEAPQTEAEMEAQARANAKTAPAAGNVKAQAKVHTNAQRKPADQANPVVGRVISEEGANLGVHSNVTMGNGAGGSVGNE